MNITYSIKPLRPKSLVTISAVTEDTRMTVKLIKFKTTHPLPTDDLTPCRETERLRTTPRKANVTPFNHRLPPVARMAPPNAPYETLLHYISPYISRGPQTAVLS